ncbi:MAG: rubrerythrin family protein [Raoultibacter sp.]
MAQLIRTEIPTAENSSNFNVVAESATTVGTTLENLKAAISGETGASAKYAAFAEAADKQGFGKIARLFRCTAAAEQLHIGLEYNLVIKAEPDFVKPTAEAPAAGTSDLNLIAGAQGEIYETVDMYPSFIKKAQEEGDNAAVAVFTRAKLAEAYHAERYLDAYNTIDVADDNEKYYLCPMCGYIHKGEDFEKCPICFVPKAKFTAF